MPALPTINPLALVVLKKRFLAQQKMKLFENYFVNLDVLSTRTNPFVSSVDNNLCIVYCNRAVLSFL